MTFTKWEALPNKNNVVLEISKFTSKMRRTLLANRMKIVCQGKNFKITPVFYNHDHLSVLSRFTDGGRIKVCSSSLPLSRWAWSTCYDDYYADCGIVIELKH